MCEEPRNRTAREDFERSVREALLPQRYTREELEMEWPEPEAEPEPTMPKTRKMGIDTDSHHDVE